MVHSAGSLHIDQHKNFLETSQSQVSRLHSAFLRTGHRHQQQAQLHSTGTSYIDITDIYSQFTSVTSHMDLEATGLVICLVTAWVGAHEVARFSEVSAIVGEQSTEGDEGFFTACTGQKTNVGQ